MKTPSKFTTNLKKGIVTKEMLGMVIYSFNKRAKNYRDKEREYRAYEFDNYGNEGKYRDKKTKMYEAKEELLKFLEPTCIHKEVFYRDIRTKYYDYEDEFYEHTNDAIRKSYYYDKEEDREIEFIVVVHEKEECVNYYLYYELDNFSFHKPIAEVESKNYKLEIIELKNFITHGIDIKEILSLKFCNKVLEGLISGEYKLI